MTITVHDWFISPYAVCMMLALLSGFGYAYYALKNENIEPRIAGLSIFMNLVFVLFGGKLYTMLVHFDSEYSLLKVPFSSVGGLLGMIVGIETFNRIYKGKEKEFRTIYILIIPLLYSVSKIGCLLVGCCHGIAYNGLGAIRYLTKFKNPEGIRALTYAKVIPTDRVFPVQLCETIVFAGIFIYSAYLYKKNERRLITDKIIFAGAVSKFALEYLRADNEGRIININQIFCLILITIVIFHVFYIKGRENGQQL